MNKKSLLGIFPVHSAAVIGNSDQRDTAACKLHGYSGSAAVYRIIDKFFYDRDGTLNDFAGLNGIGGLGIKYINPAQCLPPGTSASIHKVCSWLR